MQSLAGSPSSQTSSYDRSNYHKVEGIQWSAEPSKPLPAAVSQCECTTAANVHTHTQSLGQWGQSIMRPCPRRNDCHKLRHPLGLPLLLYDKHCSTNSRVSGQQKKREQTAAKAEGKQANRQMKLQWARQCKWDISLGRRKWAVARMISSTDQIIRARAEYIPIWLLYSRVEQDHYEQDMGT